MFPATLFDFNGVLVDDEAVHLAAFREVLAPLDVQVTDEAYVERYLGFDDVGAFRAMLADAGLAAGDARVAELVDAKKPAYMRRAEASLMIFDGAADALRGAAARGPVGIVSGALRPEIDFALERMGVRALVAFVVSAEETTRCKPDPQGYAIGIERLAPIVGRAHAARAVVVEDSRAGVQAAKAAGLACIAVAHSYPAAELAASGADLVLDRIAELDDDAVARLAARLGTRHA